MPEPSDAWPVARIRLTVGSALLVAAAFITVTLTRNLFTAAHRTIGWVVASATVALLLEPAVRMLEQRVRRPIAIAVTVLTTLLVTASVVAGVLTDLNLQVDRLKDDLPQAAASIEEHERYGEAAADFRLESRIQDFVDELDDRISQRAAAEGALDTGPAYFVNVVLVIFFLVFGTRLARAAGRQITDGERRVRYERIAVEAVVRGQHYIHRSLALAATVGLGTGVVAWNLDLPAPAVLGVVMAAFALIPNFGVLLGALPVLLLAGGFSPGITTLLLAIGFLVTQVVMATVVYRYVDTRSVRVGPAAIVIVALIGFEVYGLGGAFYGVALTVFGLAALESAVPPPEPETAPDDGAGERAPSGDEDVSGDRDDPPGDAERTPDPR